jgi:hypothetical protein
MTDIQNLQAMWDRFKDHVEHTKEDLHAPPALWEALSELTAVHLKNLGLIPDDDDTFKRIVAMTELMWFFGNYAGQNGLFRSNLEPCRCSEVTDQQIKDFFDGVNFGKEGS